MAQPSKKCVRLCDKVIVKEYDGLDSIVCEDHESGNQNFRVVPLKCFDCIQCLVQRDKSRCPRTKRLSRFLCQVGEATTDPDQSVHFNCVSSQKTAGGVPVVETPLQHVETSRTAEELGCYTSVLGSIKRRRSNRVAHLSEHACEGSDSTPSVIRLEVLSHVISIPLAALRDVTRVSTLQNVITLCNIGLREELFGKSWSHTLRMLDTNKWDASLGSPLFVCHPKDITRLSHSEWIQLPVILLDTDRLPIATFRFRLHLDKEFFWNRVELDRQRFKAAQAWKDTRERTSRTPLWLASTSFVVLKPQHQAPDSFAVCTLDELSKVTARLCVRRDQYLHEMFMDSQPQFRAVCRFIRRFWQYQQMQDYAGRSCIVMEHSNSYLASRE